MLQNCIFFYFLFFIFILVSILKTNYLHKFFFYSELIWLVLFLLILNLEILHNTNNLMLNAFFILVFTALEALIIASIILILNKKDF